MKPITKALENHDDQLEYYLNSSTNIDAKLGILTNGDDYRFFTLDENKRMDKQPFLNFRLSELKDSDIENLQKLKKENFNEDTLSDVAEDLQYATGINSILKDYLTNPPDSFIKDLMKTIKPEKKISPPMLERLKPIVKIAIQNLFSEMTRQGIENQQNEAQNKEQKISKVKKEKVTQVQPIEPKPVQPDPEKIELSEDEKKSIEIVKSILQKNGKDVSNIKHKKNPAYLSINNRVTTGWFLRLFLKGTIKKIDVDINTPNIESLTKGFKINKYPNSGVTNIIINSIDDDLKKLDKLIVTCFDEVNK